MRIYSEDGQLCLFGPGGSAGRTCQGRSAADSPRARTSGSSWRRSFELKAIPLMSLDLTPGHGNLLGESYWEIRSPWLGGSWTLNTGVLPREGRVSSLSLILEDSPPRKYYLSRKACLGILRRARERGKPLPPQLEAALKAQAGLTVYLVPVRDPPQTDVTAFAQNQRDEVRDLHDVAGALAAQPGMKQQAFVAGIVSKHYRRLASPIGAGFSPPAAMESLLGLAPLRKAGWKICWILWSMTWLNLGKE